MLKPHPISLIPPPLTELEEASLEESLLKNGQIEDITTHEGMILNGNHKYRLLIKNGIEPRLKEFIPNGVATPEDFVMAHLEGRNITPGQKSCVAAILAERRKKNPVDNLKLAPNKTGIPSIGGNKNREENRTVNIVAKEMKVGANNVSKLMVLMRHSKALFDKVYHGKCSVNSAYTEFRMSEGSRKNGPNTGTRINLNAFKTEIKIPSCFCSYDEIEVFRKTMNAHGWILEIKAANGQIQANWYGNGYPTVGTNWSTITPEFDYRRALIVAANEKQNAIKQI